jgi:hypothetical protein
MDIRGICGHFVDIFEICSMSGQIGMSTRISVICPVQQGHGHVADMSWTNETKIYIQLYVCCVT